MDGFNRYNRLIAAIMIWLAACLLLFASALAEECQWYDYSQSFEAYARLVAQINTGGEIYGASAEASQDGLWAVLCRTDGKKLTGAEEAVCAIAGPDGRYTLFYSSEPEAQAAARELACMEGVLYAEADTEVTGCSQTGGETGLSGETGYTFQSWGAQKMRFDAYLPYEAQWGSGSATVAVIDSGVFYHSALDDRIPVSGYDYVDADRDARNDLFGHGTHVAGIVADCTAGAPVYIYPIRVLNAVGAGKMSNVVNAVLEAVEYGADVINLSMESAIMSAALDDAIAEALNESVVVVIAAGNSGCDTSKVCPAHITAAGAVVVGAAENSDGTYRRASYSNYGSSVDVYAFGTNISSCSRTGGYSLDSGTSMATPHISAVCALMRLIHPGISPEEMETRLVAASGGGTVNVPDLYGMVPKQMGFGLQSVSLDRSDSVELPRRATPGSACETIRYVSSDTDVAEIDGRTLRAKNAGTAVVTASCTGLEEIQFQVTVSAEDGGKTLALPEGMTELADYAFSGDIALRHVLLPDGVRKIGTGAFEDCGGLSTVRAPDSLEEIGENAFAEAILLCKEGSAALAYAVENGRQYIILE